VHEVTNAPGAVQASALPSRVELLGPFVRYGDAIAAVAENRLGYPLVFRAVVEATRARDVETEGRA